MKRKRTNTSNSTLLATAALAVALQPPPRPRTDSPRENAEALAKMAEDAKSAVLSPPSADLCPCGHPAWTHASAAQIAMRLRETAGQWSKECEGAATRLGAAHCRCTHSREDVADAAKPRAADRQIVGRIERASLPYPVDHRSLDEKFQDALDRKRDADTPRSTS